MIKLKIASFPTDRSKELSIPKWLEADNLETRRLWRSARQIIVDTDVWSRIFDYAAVLVSELKKSEYDAEISRLPVTWSDHISQRLDEKQRRSDKPDWWNEKWSNGDHGAL
jgi:hypothetical protein